jgi:hypothetical protein
MKAAIQKVRDIQEAAKKAKAERAESHLAEVQEARASGFPLYGNTYPHKDAIRAAGGKWDSDRKSWILPTKESFDRMNERVNGVKPLQKGEVQFSQGSGYGGRSLPIGTVLKTPKSILEKHPEIGEYSVVTSVKSRYFSDDGMSFGVGDDSGHIYTFTVRAATPDESKPFRDQESEKEAVRKAKIGLSELANNVDSDGEFPPMGSVPEGRILFDSGNIYGGGDWWVIGPEWIWHVKNNGTDGDDWSRNNVRTGGAGGIGHRVPYTPELAAKLNALQAVIGGAMAS